LEAPFEQPDPAWIVELGSSAYRRWVAGSARRRTSRAQLQRNAAVALGNRRSRDDVPVLCRVLSQSSYPLVRGHVAWALGQIGGEEARSALAAQLELEADAWTRDEISAALKQLVP
jgi:epoxyqueuosine reductase